MKFTDVELSRILSAHEGGQMRRNGEAWDGPAINGDGYQACVLQAAKLVSGNMTASDLCPVLARQFDCNYERFWTPDELLAWLEAQGVA